MFVSHSLRQSVLIFLNLSKLKNMILMVDLRNFYFDFMHGFLVKQVFFYHFSYCSSCNSEPGNVYLLEMAMNCLVFVCLCFAGLGIIRIEQMLKKERAKIFVKMDTECWKLLVKKIFSLKELIILI